METEVCSARSTVQMQKTVPLLIVEGNVGAGKSTFLRMLAAYVDMQAIFEPDKLWQNVNGENLLDLFYKDPQRWAYTFQTYVFVTRVQTLRQADLENVQPLQVLERSVYSDRFCFAKNGYELGYLNSLEWSMYTQWFSWLVGSYVRKPSAFIYLRTDPVICFERLKKRSRSEEVGVTLEYIERLHAKHEEWLVGGRELDWQQENIPVLVLDNNRDFEDNIQVQRDHVQAILDFLRTRLNINSENCVKSGF